MVLRFVRRRVDSVENWVEKRTEPLMSQCSEPAGQIIGVLDKQVDEQLIEPLASRASKMISYIPGARSILGLVA